MYLKILNFYMINRPEKSKSVIRPKALSSNIPTSSAPKLATLPKSKVSWFFFFKLVNRSNLYIL